MRVRSSDGPQQVFENHRILFTVGTSIASVLIAWAGTLLPALAHQL
jgi:hypothetical protein